MTLHLSKCHSVGNHMSWLIYIWGEVCPKQQKDSVIWHSSRNQSLTEYSIFGMSFNKYAKLLDFGIIYLQIFTELKWDFGWIWILDGNYLL